MEHQPLLYQPNMEILQSISMLEEFKMMIKSLFYFTYFPFDINMPERKGDSVYKEVLLMSLFTDLTIFVVGGITLIIITFIIYLLNYMILFWVGLIVLVSLMILFPIFIGGYEYSIEFNIHHKDYYNYIKRKSYLSITVFFYFPLYPISLIYYFIIISIIYYTINVYRLFQKLIGLCCNSCNLREKEESLI